MIPKTVSAASLKKRGWTTDLLRLHLVQRDDRYGPRYDPLEASRARHRLDVREDFARAKAGEPVVFTRRDLRERGWKDVMITDILRKPDRKIPNTPTQKTYLWRAVRVLEAERTDEFAERRVPAAGTPAAEARDAAVRAAVAEIAQTLVVRNPHRTYAQLADAAVKHRNKVQSQRGITGAPASADTAKPAAVERWIENYLLHVCTDYDGLLGRLIREHGDRGVRDIYDQIVRVRADILVLAEIQKIKKASA